MILTFPINVITFITVLTTLRKASVIQNWSPSMSIGYVTTSAGVIDLSERIDLPEPFLSLEPKINRVADLSTALAMAIEGRGGVVGVCVSDVNLDRALSSLADIVRTEADSLRDDWYRAYAVAPHLAEAS